MGRRALSIQNLIDYTPKTLGFTGRWLDAMGDPEPYGSWIIWGASGNGKTRFAVQLVKYLMSFEGLRIAYNGLEEGMSETYRRAIIDTGLQMEKQGRYVFWDGFNYEDMMERLKRKRSPNVVVIDSLQYLNITYDQYKELVRKYPKKLFIWISHESGTEPKGGTAQSIMYNSNIKIRVHNYYATIISRYKGKEVFDIWPEKHINR